VWPTARAGSDEALACDRGRRDGKERRERARRHSLPAPSPVAEEAGEKGDAKRALAAPLCTLPTSLSPAATHPRRPRRSPPPHMSAPPAALAAAAAAAPEVVVVDAPDDAPYCMSSVCMKCYEQVREGVRAGGGAMARGRAAADWPAPPTPTPPPLLPSLLGRDAHAHDQDPPLSGGHGLLVRVPSLRQPVGRRGEGGRAAEARELATHPRPPRPTPSHSNNEIQFAGAFGERGTIHTLTVPPGDRTARDRQLVKADTATARVPELDFDIPAGTQAGTITTVEGLLSEAATALRALQPERAVADPAAAAAIDAFCAKLDDAAGGGMGFTLVLNDPAGNSGVESSGPGDPLLSVAHYERTREQAIACGLIPKGEEEEGEAAPPSSSAPEIAPDDPHHGATPLGAAAAHRALARLGGDDAAAVIARYTAPEEVMELPGRCGACGARTTTRMFQTRIPFFKDVILMADACDACGYRNAEVKGGGGVPDKGRRVTLLVRDAADLQRDVIKAETARLAIPEIGLEVTTGALGGCVTTVEGLVVAVKDALAKTHGFALGDGAAPAGAAAWKKFFGDLDACARLDAPWTLRLDDPLANTFVSGVPGADAGDGSAPRADPRLTVEDYERSPDEDAEFGIDHLRRHAAENDAGGGVGAIAEDEGGAGE